MDFGLLLLILFIVAPLLEKLLKAGRPKQPPGQEPGQQQPGQRRPGQAGPQAQPRPRPQPRMEEEEEPAAAMLPDDLWEILTGERRPTAPPQQRGEPDFSYDEPPTRSVPPPPAPAPPPRRAEPPMRSRAPRQEPDRTRPQRSTPSRERRLPQVEQRRLPEVDERRLPPVEIRRPGPTVRARSAGPPPSAADDLVRGVPIHEPPRVVSLETPIEDPETRRARFKQRLADTAEPRTGFEAEPNAYAFESVDDVRRAIIMSEILGPPKGLQ